MDREKRRREEEEPQPQEKKSRKTAKSAMVDLDSEAVTGVFVFNDQFAQDLSDQDRLTLKSDLKNFFSRKHTTRTLVFDNISTKAALLVVQAAPEQTNDSLHLTNVTYKTIRLILPFINRFYSIGIGKLDSKAAQELAKLFREYKKKIDLDQKTDAPELQELTLTSVPLEKLIAIGPFLPDFKKTTLLLENLDSNTASGLPPVLKKFNELNLFLINKKLMMALAPLILDFFKGSNIGVGNLETDAMKVFVKCFSNEKLTGKELTVFASNEPSIAFLAHALISSQFSIVHLVNITRRSIETIFSALKKTKIDLGLDGRLPDRALEYGLDNLEPLKIKKLVLTGFTDAQFHIALKRRDLLIKMGIQVLLQPASVEWESYFQTPKMAPEQKLSLTPGEAAARMGCSSAVLPTSSLLTQRPSRNPEKVVLSLSLISSPS